MRPLTPGATHSCPNSVRFRRVAANRTAKPLHFAGVGLSRNERRLAAPGEERPEGGFSGQFVGVRVSFGRQKDRKVGSGLFFSCGKCMQETRREPISSNYPDIGSQEAEPV